MATDIIDSIQLESSEYIRFAEVIPCCGVGCCLSSLYTDYPDCFGCTFRTTCCCFRNECLICKPSRFDDARFAILHLLCDYAPWAALLKTQNQVCYEDCRCSVPPDDRDAPCIITFCFLTVYYRNGCSCYFCRRARDMRP